MREEYTIGVEEEYQLVDADTGALRSRASDVLSTDWADEIRGELHETTVEIGTRICDGLDAVERELSRVRFQAATAAAAEGLEIAAAGTHPFSGWHGHGIQPGSRYLEMALRHDRVARAVNIFGMHIHVGIPERVDRIALLEQVRGFVPHLLALSCSSPFLDADDTGFASYRAILWRQYPYTGIPPRFESEGEFEEFVGLLLRSEAIRDRGNIYWSVRPHFSYPTIEFRATDACPRLEDAATIAGLARLLVAGAAEGGVEPPGGGSFSDDAWRSILTENEWQAARYGLDAFLTAPTEGSGRVAVRTALRRLLDELAATAESFGETDVLKRVEELLERGNGADRMRRVHRESGSFEEVVRWLVRETRLGTGFDRRRSQRVGAT
ncbi:MAG TPA: YbdK family carboxylate-amine ligase [Longimicrobiales bacterium]|nr:YbdK family carboxylate-amine ligase [Longimicrobiales bacterium]